MWCLKSAVYLMTRLPARDAAYARYRHGKIPDHGKSPATEAKRAVHPFLKIVRILPWDAEAADWHIETRHQIISTGQADGFVSLLFSVDQQPENFSKT